ncbi:ABC transporter permease, partial [Streptomyces sp. SID7958]|nr:ABC transporter permease [Streptomyces sp. SID7958]
QVPQPSASEVAAVATDRYLDSTGARPGQRVDVAVDGSTVPVRIVRSVRDLPSTTPGGADDGGALLLDLRAVNRILQTRHDAGAPPNEWWLRTAPGATDRVAAALRDRPEVEPS